MNKSATIIACTLASISLVTPILLYLMEDYSDFCLGIYNSNHTEFSLFSEYGPIKRTILNCCSDRCQNTLGAISEFMRPVYNIILDSGLYTPQWLDEKGSPLPDYPGPRSAPVRTTTSYGVQLDRGDTLNLLPGQYLLKVSKEENAQILMPPRVVGGKRTVVVSNLETIGVKAPYITGKLNTGKSEPQSQYFWLNVDTDSMINGLSKRQWHEHLVEADWKEARTISVRDPNLKYELDTAIKSDRSNQ